MYCIPTTVYKRLPIGSVFISWQRIGGEFNYSIGSVFIYPWSILQRCGNQVRRSNRFSIEALLTKFCLQNGLVTRFGVYNALTTECFLLNYEDLCNPWCILQNGAHARSPTKWLRVGHIGSVCNYMLRIGSQSLLQNGLAPKLCLPNGLATNMFFLVSGPVTIAPKQVSPNQNPCHVPKQHKPNDCVTDIDCGPKPAILRWIQRGCCCCCCCCCCCFNASTIKCRAYSL